MLMQLSVLGLTRLISDAAVSDTFLLMALDLRCCQLSKGEGRLVPANNLFVYSNLTIPSLNSHNLSSFEDAPFHGV